MQCCRSKPTPTRILRLSNSSSASCHRQTVALDLEITIKEQPSDLVGLVPGGDAGRSMSQGPTTRWIDDLELVVHHDLGAVARVDDASLTIGCAPDLDDRSRAIRQLLFSALSWWFERQGRLLLHGAMIARGTDAALILGDTGAGKSTAAYAGLRAGWDLCSDDLVVVDASGSSLTERRHPQGVVDRQCPRRHVDGHSTRAASRG